MELVVGFDLNLLDMNQLQELVKAQSAKLAELSAQNKKIVELAKQHVEKSKKQEQAFAIQKERLDEVTMMLQGTHERVRKLEGDNKEVDSTAISKQEKVRQAEYNNKAIIQSLETKLVEYQESKVGLERRLNQELQRGEDLTEKLKKIVQVSKALRDEKVKSDQWIAWAKDALQKAGLEIRQLKMMLEKKNEEADRQKEKIDRLEKELFVLRKQLDSNNSNLKTSSAQEAQQARALEAAEREITNLRNIISNMNTQLKELQAERDSKEEALNERNMQIEKIKSEAKAKYDSLQDELTNTFNELTIAKADYNKLKAEKRNNSGNFSKKDVNRLQQQVDAYKSAMEELQLSNEELTEKITKLEDHNTKLKEEKSRIMKEIQNVPAKSQFCYQQEDQESPRKLTTSQSHKSEKKKKKRSSQSSTSLPRTIKRPTSSFTAGGTSSIDKRSKSTTSPQIFKCKGGTTTITTNENENITASSNSVVRTSTVNPNSSANDDLCRLLESIDNMGDFVWDVAVKPATTSNLPSSGSSGSMSRSSSKGLGRGWIGGWVGRGGGAERGASGIRASQAITSPVLNGNGQTSQAITGLVVNGNTTQSANASANAITGGAGGGSISARGGATAPLATSTGASLASSAGSGKTGRGGALARKNTVGPVAGNVTPLVDLWGYDYSDLDALINELGEFKLDSPTPILGADFDYSFLDGLSDSEI